MIVSDRDIYKDLQAMSEGIRKKSELLAVEHKTLTSKLRSQLDANVKSPTISEANDSGIHMTLSKDALKALSEKSTAEYNKIVDDASSKSGALSEDVMNRFKTNTLSQAKSTMLAQANSSPQAVLALLS